MISRISGTIVDTTNKSLVVDVHGVGYLVFVTTDAIARVESQHMEAVTLWTYLAVRENAMELFGFFSQEELDFFQMLIDISCLMPTSILDRLSPSSR